MKNILRCCAVLAALAAAVSQASAGELMLSMQNGRVSIVADNVPLRQILQEWARVAQATIVNADKLASPNISIRLTDAPEKEALDILLRSAAGYIAAPRPVLVAGAGTYDRITIMATSRAPAATASAVMPTPTFQRQPPPDDDGDEPINVPMPMPQAQPNPVTGQFPGMPPQQQNVQPGNGATSVPTVLMPPGQQPPATAAQPGPLTSPRPGALPAPPMPYPNPYQPQPVRPGGGGPGGGGGGQ